MRVRSWLVTVTLVLGAVAPASAQKSSSVFQGGFNPPPSGGSSVFDSSRLVTPIPKVEQPKKPFSFTSLIPNFLLPGSSNVPAGRSVGAPTAPNPRVYQPVAPTQPN